MCVVCACACACMHACMRVHLRVCVHVSMHVRVFRVTAWSLTMWDEMLL